MLDFITTNLPTEQIEVLAVQFANYTKENPVVGGIAALWVAGLLTFFTRSIPNRIRAVIEKQFVVSVTIHNRDHVFDDIARWYEKIGVGKKARTMRAVNNPNNWQETEIQAGYGTHYFWRGLRCFKLQKWESSDKTTGDMIKESISISTIGRSQKPIRDLIDTCKPKQVKKKEITNIWRWGSDNWCHSHGQEPRKFDSVILPKKDKERILKTIERFKEDEKFYKDNGIPYHLGICLHGIPGTGKTSIVKGLCSYLKRDLCILNLGSMSDKSLEQALSVVRGNSIILMEDMDSELPTSARGRVVKKIEKSKEPPTMSGEVAKVNGTVEEDDSNSMSGLFNTLSLSGILNAIDGASGGDGRILIMTTNDPDRLDPALKRKGRIDLMIELGPLVSETFREMFKRLYGGYEIPEDVVFKNGISPAELQGMVLENRNDPDLVLKMVSNGSLKDNKFIDKEAVL